VYVEKRLTITDVRFFDHYSTTGEYRMQPAICWTGVIQGVSVGDQN